MGINVQAKINKLLKAFECLNKIVKISTEQFYSVKFKKTFTEYTVNITTEQEILKRKEMYELKKEYKRTGDKTTFDRITDLEEEISLMSIPLFKCRNKTDMLLYLVGKYKELVE